MEEHLEHDKYNRQIDIDQGDGNYRNDYRKKPLRSSLGDIDSEIQRNLKSYFQLRIIKNMK